MAKEQNLSLNPAKISGICSRLMCCLKYESEGYRITRADSPQVGAKVRHLDVVGKVLEQNIMKETLLIELANGDRTEVPMGEVEVIDAKGGAPVVPPVQENEMEDPE
jgi:cell fate regulator YaaT (PSP1 superfamily)